MFSVTAVDSVKDIYSCLSADTSFQTFLETAVHFEKDTGVHLLIHVFKFGDSCLHGQQWKIIILSVYAKHWMALLD